MDVNLTGDSGSLQLVCTAEDLNLSFSDVVIIFAVNEYFVPYLSVALQSIIEHADTKRHYDIVVLTGDLTLQTIRTLQDQLSNKNFDIGFLNVEAQLDSAALPRHGHFRIQTYYRLLAPELLADVDKAIYLDCDLVVRRDLADLFDIDLQGNLVAATQDADMAGQVSGYDPTIYGYLHDIVGLSDPYDYFQAGVLVMNLTRLRDEFSSAMLLDIASSRHWQWLDQDVLNKVCAGTYKRIDMAWNTLMDWQHLRRSHIIAEAPYAVRAAYEKARENPYVVHYAGPDDRPWDRPHCDMADFFWDFAERCPYKSELNRRLMNYRRSFVGLIKQMRAVVLYRVGLSLFDALMPPKSRVRRQAIKLYKRIGFQFN